MGQRRKATHAQIRSGISAFVAAIRDTSPTILSGPK
jgi:hypothetical protein